MLQNKASLLSMFPRGPGAAAEILLIPVNSFRFFSPGPIFACLPPRPLLEGLTALKAAAAERILTFALLKKNLIKPLDSL